ncbi:hypothetical protein SAMN05216587_10231 [Selenomonas ruminantium]|uniref:Uncharacterized protein n=1 Tax=Selenomonas ruminantium TaxID=971 RepID=A0A1I0W1Z9_SELRU|nr:hypothetical protein SAMN05216587_10231 [Selenomonas ruminantium]
MCSSSWLLFGFRHSIHGMFYPVFYTFVVLRGAGAAAIYPNLCGTIMFQVGAVAKDIVHKSKILTPTASGHTSEFLNGDFIFHFVCIVFHFSSLLPVSITSGNFPIYYFHIHFSYLL